MSQNTAIIYKLVILAVFAWLLSANGKYGPVTLGLSLFVWLHRLTNKGGGKGRFAMGDASLIRVLSYYSGDKLLGYIKHMGTGKLKYCLKVVDGHGLPEITHILNQALQAKQ